MEIKDFIGKGVIERRSKKRYVLSEITSPYIAANEEHPTSDSRGSYIWDTINGDPFESGVLVFEDSSLAEPFRVTYDSYCRSREAYWEDCGYWMRKD